MYLSFEESDLFFRTNLSLHLYVNRELGLYPNANSLDDLLTLKLDDKMAIRNALYDHPELIDRLVKENPFGLDGEELELAASWKNFIRDKFIIERQLKKHAIFIRNDEVYGVLGLSHKIAQIEGGLAYPVMVETVLLPFKDRIVYDGLLNRYNVILGPGIKKMLKETYMSAKRNGRIITSLVGHGPSEGAGKGRGQKGKAPASSRALQEKRRILAELSERARRLRRSVHDPEICSPAFSLLKASIEFAQLASSDIQDFHQQQKCLKKLKATLRKLENSLYF
jgi:hypothetical protein